MIKRLYVNNFRCLENFEILLSEQPSTLLFGKNGSGKSTVGFVLEVFQNIAHGTNRVGQLVRPSDFAQSRSNVPIRFEIEVVLEGKLFEYTLALELPAGFKEIRVFEENFIVDGTPIYLREGAQVQLARTNKAASANFLVDWHLVALPVIQEQSTSDPLYIFKTWLAHMLILAPMPSLITGDSEGETLTPKRDVTDLGEWFTGLITSSPAAYAKIDKHLKEVMPDFKDIQNPTRGSDARTLTVQFQQDRGSISLPFRSLSDGEKCFVICAVALAANEAFGPIFCFWDEPDNYLALAEVGFFVMALRRSFQHNGQLLITSHNPEAIRKFSDENTLVMGRRNHLEPTLVRMLSEIQVRGDLVDALIRDEVEPWA